MKFFEDTLRIFKIIRYRYFGGPRVYQDVYASLREPLPILVYQMGKVGSKSIYDSLTSAGIDAFHVHRIGADVHPNLFRRVVENKERAKVITLVREPVSHSISTFFQHLEKYCNSPDAANLPNDELLKHYLKLWNSEQAPSITWFQNEFSTTLDMDVFSTPFPKKQRFTVLRGNHDVLILRSDLSDNQKSEAISEFLQLPDFTITRSNVTNDSPKGATYTRFKSAVKLPDNILNTLQNSKYSKHFF